MNAANIDHIYEYGDVYETIDACDELETKLSRLKRRRILGDEEWQATKHSVEVIRSQLEDHIPESALQPKGPRLP